LVLISNEKVNPKVFILAKLEQLSRKINDKLGLFVIIIKFENKYRVYLKIKD
jgi:hypothetical protein